ncbi:MAG: hypothetical protein ACO1RT_10580 [Planctomycetaceae bacterium]
MRIYQFSIANVALLALFATGCGPKPAEPGADASDSAATETVTMDSPPPMTVDIHAHPSEGPHRGTLVELGNEEFHAEVVHDDESVTIYVLDAGATKAVPIDSKEVTINLMHDGAPEQFKLAASPDTGDPSGKSSRFMLANAELVGHIDDDAAAPKLVLTINNTSYRGEIKHDHDGHDHSRHDH